VTRIVQSLSEISAQYDALFVDLWGCVHNGVKAFPEAVTSLQDYRKSGGKVILVTNAPRTRHSVESHLEILEVPTDAWDAIATSGDSARTALYSGAVGRKVYFIGLEDDKRVFSPPEVLNNPVDVELTPLSEAEGIVCTGPFDPFADPAENRSDFLYAKQKGMKLICFNPDIVVDRGEKREWCAGALAELYTEMGGESLYFGKPHPPIYDLARLRLNALGCKTSNDRILAIGDGIQTDIVGAMGEDIDSLFITGGLAAEETKTSQQPDAQALDAFLQREMQAPTYAIGYLR